ncbi:MAG: hypothetical protein WAW42_02540 [Candidatus Competibacteraceae bacterium]
MQYWIDRAPGPFRAGALALTLIITAGGTGCASGPGEKNLLPDAGPTTLEIVERHLSGEMAQPTALPRGSAAAPSFEREIILPGLAMDSRRSHQAFTDFQEDFQRIHNPEIIAYVYAHFAGDLPVPGYYTVFPLREGMHYAEDGQGEGEW